MRDSRVMTDIAALKQQARATWAAGDFDAVAEFIWEAGGVAAEAAGCGPSDRVLDIAAGSGNAAVQAAQRGATVVASDLTPELFAAGRRRAEPAGVELEWVEADAEELPFEDASFDVAVSTFGIMFAPRQSVAAAELARVVKPGGRIALCSWQPSGFVGEMFATVARFLTRRRRSRGRRCAGAPRRARMSCSTRRSRSAVSRGSCDSASTARRRDDRLLHGSVRADGDGPQGA